MTLKVGILKRHQRTPSYCWSQQWISVSCPQVEDDVVRQCLARDTDNAADMLPAAQESPRKKAKVDSALAVLFGTNILDVTHNEQAVPPSKEQSVRLELQGYGQESPIPVTEIPLEWWASWQSKYPKLSTLARRMLAVPGTSVPTERIFSAAGATVTARQSSLSPDNVDKLLFLHKNFKKDQNGLRCDICPMDYELIRP